jgi:uncharacterized glyoxalase superfamily protein PhnB
MERAIPILPMDDPDSTRRFYVDGLGFHVVFEVPYANGKGVIMGVERGGLRIHLDSPMPGHGRNACVYLDVADADKLYEEWKGKVEIRKPPATQSWGVRTFDVTDPSGNTLFVVGPDKSCG